MFFRSSPPLLSFKGANQQIVALYKNGSNFANIFFLCYKQLQLRTRFYVITEIDQFCLILMRVGNIGNCNQWFETWLSWIYRMRVKSKGWIRVYCGLGGWWGGLWRWWKLLKDYPSTLARVKVTMLTQWLFFESSTRHTSY